MATIAGSSMFVMSILYILMMFAAPAINPNGGYVSMDWSMKNLIPNFNVEYITSLSILVFAVGGIEKISPYVNKMEGNPAKQFPKSMIFAAVMELPFVAVSYDPKIDGFVKDINGINAGKVEELQAAQVVAAAHKALAPETSAHGMLDKLRAKALLNAQEAFELLSRGDVR